MKPNDAFSYRYANNKDIAALSKLHIKTFANSLGTSIGTRYAREFFKWFIDNDSTIAIACCKSERIIGYAIGAPDGYSGELTKSTLPHILLGIASHPKSLLHPNFSIEMTVRFKNLLRGIFTTKNSRSPINIQTDKTPFVLVGIGIDPEFRRRHIGITLLENFENEVWRKLFTKIRLTVHESNIKAISFYEKADWQFDYKNRSKMRYVKIKSDMFNG
tara:strand:+ start:593 stop:1243 length:651 start_codon:yes stop_codon:yes gene_type:complete